ncbi:MAG: NAD(P)/FAD-dependent oxidoreductase [Pseudomonadota bacterium]
MEYDTVIIGGGAAGMMCAAHCGGRVLVIDHAKSPGEQIRISGGGRCNFTNIHAGSDNFLSKNPHFAKSALARYTPWDFVALVDTHGIAWHEKTLGQLFCDHSAKDIIAMLRLMMDASGAELRLRARVEDIKKGAQGYTMQCISDGGAQTLRATHLVIATGGKSIPKMGASGFAYDVARQFGIPVTATRAALVPFTFAEKRFAEISGVAVATRVTANDATFEEATLFTHRGLSGPAVLQASSYWREGETITLDLDPAAQLRDQLRAQRQASGRKNFTTELSRHLPARLVDHLSTQIDLSGNLADWSDARLTDLAQTLSHWQLKPSGTEGYRTAEVTLGGIDTDALSARDMMAKDVSNLYFIGEAVDVTGWLGGYNFQWAWASAMACARAISG